jgi:hypothetical protein
MNCLSGRVDTLAIKLLCVDGAYVDETRVTTGKRWRMGGILAGKFARKLETTCISSGELEKVQRLLRTLAREGKFPVRHSRLNRTSGWPAGVMCIVSLVSRILRICG